MNRQKLLILLIFSAGMYSCSVKTQAVAKENAKSDFTMITIPYNVIDSCFPDFHLDDTLAQIFDSIGVYNRWGEKLYHNDNLKDHWICADDTTVKLPEGTYFYVLWFRKAFIGDQVDYMSGTITYIKKH